RVLSGKTECKQDTENQRSSTWYLKTSNDSIRVTKAACFDRYICWEQQKFTEICLSTLDCNRINFVDNLAKFDT
ncbi:hypothetical protein PMAYCL1PPCAC_08829, partial [Pristionchus mayeri]